MFTNLYRNFYISLGTEIFNHLFFFVFDNNLLVHLQKTTLLQTLVCRVGLLRFANVLFCGWGFICLCAGGEKNKINSSQTAPPYHWSTIPVNPFFVIISFLIVSMYRVGFLHLLTTVNYRVGQGNFTPSLSYRCTSVYVTVSRHMLTPKLQHRRYGSSNFRCKYKLILSQVGKSQLKLANPFAPFPLQELLHYYGLACPCMMHRY